MENAAKLLQALSSVLWPLLAIVAAWALRIPVRKVIESWAWRKTTVKVGGLEISMEDYNKQQRDLIGDLQQKVIDIEKHLNKLPRVAPRLSDEETVARSILWVDDHPENHAQIIEQLNNKDVSVIQEKTTEAALGRMATSRFDIVITDMHRIEFGLAHNEAGMELIRTMRERNKTTPIIVFFGRSSRPAYRYRDIAVEAGANLVTSSPTELLAAIEMPNKLLNADAR